jgi:prepilin-type N-terminal cleavage/methylation domain-containing protein
MKKNGYTLLELLVVIGLITILISFGATSYSTAQQKARDSRRRSDLKALQNALEQYYSICKFSYPTPAVGSVFTEVKARTADNCDKDVTILENLKDPMDLSYTCQGACDGTVYTICPALVSGSATRYLETDSGCTTDSMECCLKSQQ